jgi:hypothetical protein
MTDRDPYLDPLPEKRARVTQSFFGQAEGSEMVQLEAIKKITISTRASRRPVPSEAEGIPILFRNGPTPCT